ncbi:hypothetical protein SNE40_022802 [Patella caerulea]|uniref:Uncharacterized protein n=1 Tax=Patella caerulea TaxID=87958 RepID=A0AAN8IY03_PATCE
MASTEIPVANNIHSLTNGIENHIEFTSNLTSPEPQVEDTTITKFCLDCQVSITETLFSQKHSSHHVKPVHRDTSVREQQFVLVDTISQVKRDTIPKLQNSIATLDEIRIDVDRCYQSVTDSITQKFDTLARLLEERRHAMLSEVTAITQNRQDRLSEQRDSAYNTLTIITNCCHTAINATFESEDDPNLLATIKWKRQSLNDLLAFPVQEAPEPPCAMLFDSSGMEEIHNLVKTFGCIQSAGASRLDVQIKGDGIKHFVVGRPARFNITIKDRVLQIEKASLVVEVVDDGSTEKTIATVTELETGCYDIKYTLSKDCVHFVHVRIYGQSIQNSPFRVDPKKEVEPEITFSRIPKKQSKPPGRNNKSPPKYVMTAKNTMIEDDLIMRVGIKGRNKGEFINPQGICCANGKILVADSNNQVVQVFNLDGECKLKFGSPGRVAGKIQRPTGVSVTNNGNFLIADYENRWISIFGPDGKYINKIGSRKLLGPKGVTVDKNGRIIVVDNKSSTICIFQNNGKLLAQFGTPGNRDNQFAGPHYVAVNSNNDIIITDFHNHKVKVYDSDGQFLHCFGSNGQGNGQFNAPTGVAVDSQDNILVADWGNSRIQVFDSQGSFLSYVNTSAELLYGPQGLAVITDGQIAVSDSGNHCFKIYRYLQ